MAIEEKIAAAKQINELLNNIVRLGGFRVKYRIAVDPPVTRERSGTSRRSWWTFPVRTAGCWLLAAVNCSTRSSC